MIFLAIQNTYTSLTIALMDNETIVDSRNCDKKEATSMFIPLLQDLLEHHTLTLSSCSFIAVNYGPGPFTTLRVVISSINGLGYTHQIPLIGVDALESMTYEYYDPQYPHTVIMLNAFSGDAYYGIMAQDKLQESGVLPADAIMKKIASINGPIRCIGNGVTLYKDIITSHRPDIVIPAEFPDYCSIESVAAIGLKLFATEKTHTYQIMPRYIKKGLSA